MSASGLGPTASGMKVWPPAALLGPTGPPSTFSNPATHCALKKLLHCQQVTGSCTQMPQLPDGGGYGQPARPHMHGPESRDPGEPSSDGMRHNVDHE